MSEEQQVELPEEELRVVVESGIPAGNFGGKKRTNAQNVSETGHKNSEERRGNPTSPEGEQTMNEQQQQRTNGNGTPAPAAGGGVFVMGADHRSQLTRLKDNSLVILVGAGLTAGLTTLGVRFLGTRAPAAVEAVV